MTAPVLTFAVGTTTLAEMERVLVLTTVAYYNGNYTQAAAALGVGWQTVYRRLRRYTTGGDAQQATRP